MAATLPVKIHAHTPSRGWNLEYAQLRHWIGNVLLAAMFFLSALPNARRLDRGPANIIWVVGALLMGAMSLVRFPPRAVMMDSRAFASTIAVFLLPCFVRPAASSVGLLAWTGTGLEIAGVVLSQTARIYMGRSFGILPGNRGIVVKGPFGLMRHPIYADWFLLTLGYLAAYPSWLNCFIVIATVPFMMWRILLEEELLINDPDYRGYAQRVHFRLIPGLF